MDGKLSLQKDVLRYLNKVFILGVLQKSASRPVGKILE